jgi:hypothetical protein
MRCSTVQASSYWWIQVEPTTSSAPILLTPTASKSTGSTPLSPSTMGMRYHVTLCLSIYQYTLVASFNIQIHNGSNIFNIDAFLLDISNNIDIILGLPWLTILGHVTWDFTTMELLYFCNGHPYILNIVPRQQAPTTNLALIAHQLGVHIAWSSTTHIPHPVTNRSQHVRLPNSLNNINIPDNIILTYMC